MSDAIPIPGFLDGLQPTVQAVRQSSLPQPPLPPPEQVLQQAAALLPPWLLDPQLVARATPALQQVESIVNEVRARNPNLDPTLNIINVWGGVRHLKLPSAGSHCCVLPWAFLVLATS